MTSPHPQREEAARLWPEYAPKPRSFISTQPGSLEHVWWIVIGMESRDIGIYYGWANPHSVWVAVPAGLIAIGGMYILRWVFRQ